jgi:hypothetical protein
MLLAGPTVTGWLLLGEFIFTLAMALQCYPLQPGGLLAIQAVLIGLTTPESVYEEVTGAFPVILLLIFMVAGIYFLRDLLLFVFTRLILRIRSRESLALMFCVFRQCCPPFSTPDRSSRRVTVGGFHRSITASLRASPTTPTTIQRRTEVQVCTATQEVPRVPARLMIHAPSARSAE